MSVCEVVYTTSHEIDPSSAREVLAFVLLRPELFSDEPSEQRAVAVELWPQKRRAIAEWLKSRGRR